ncbi:MAG: CRTAC1 family protein [Acidobacteriota bacterium]
MPSEVVAQQNPKPQTGKSYSTAEPPKRQSAPVPEAPSPVTFTDMTRQCGLAFKHAASQTAQKYLLETMGGGVALFDYDNDGRMDLFFANGALLTDQMAKDARPDKRDAKFWNRLYHQKSDGTFEDVTERAGVKGEGYSMGVSVGDYDNDGFADMYVTGYGANILYRNNGNGTFTDVTKSALVAASGWSTSAGWLDYDKDGRLDLFVCRYVVWDFDLGTLYCGDMRPGFRAYCHPDNFKSLPNILYHQKADGTFEDVSAKSKIGEPGGKGLGVVFADFDNDGWTDILVANDSVRQSLYKNNGDGTFEDIALPAGVAYDENGKTFAGMGVDAADYNEDGSVDIFMTALSNETYPLYENNGDHTFTYETNTSGVGQITLLNSGWGARFVDLDNDGWRDIFVAQSHVLDTIEKTSSYLKYKQPPLFLRNTGKNFVSVSGSAGASFAVAIAARGAAFGDLDNDGDVDVVMGTLDSAPLVLRNNGTKNHWLGLALIGTKSNRQGLGSRVTVTEASGRKRIFDITTSGSYLSSNDARLIIGLGAATGVKNIEIKWPSGQPQLIENPAIDRYHQIKETDRKLSGRVDREH